MVKCELASRLYRYERYMLENHFIFYEKHFLDFMTHKLWEKTILYRKLYAINREAPVKTNFLSFVVVWWNRGLSDSVFSADFKNTLENFLGPIFISVINDVTCHHFDVPFFCFAYYRASISLNGEILGFLSSEKRGDSDEPTFVG